MLQRFLEGLGLHSFKIVRELSLETELSLLSWVCIESDSFCDSFSVPEKGTSRQRSGKGAIRKRFPLQKQRWENTKLTIRYLYHENM